MSTPPDDLRARKRLATRQGISDAARRLFWERGFDQVTVDEVAAAADVGRMTVFNHFPRKEDLFFDRDESGRALLREALQQREPRVPPVEALRQLAHHLVAQQAPYISFTANGRRFIDAVEASAALKARARAIRDELALLAAKALADGAGRPSGDTAAHLAAGLLLATWTVAFVQAHQAYREDGNAEAAQALFLALIDKGTLGVNAALAGTPYV